MSGEKEEDYAWTVEQLTIICRKYNNLALKEAVGTDRAFALMNALRNLDFFA